MKRMKLYGPAAAAAASAAALESHSAGVDVTNEMVALSQHTAAFEAMEVQLADAQDVALSLEELRDVVKSFGDAPMSPQTAAVVALTSEQLAARVGITKPIVPALENFSIEGLRSVSHQMALEGLGDAIKAVWEAIVKAFAKLIDWIKGLFTKSKASGEKLSAKAEETKAKAQALLPAPKEQPKNINAHVYRALWTSKGVANLEVAAYTLQAAKASTDGDVIKYLKAIAGELQNGDPEKVVSKADTGRMHSIAPEGMEEVHKIPGREIPAGMKAYRTGELLGGVAHYILAAQENVGQAGAEAHARNDALQAPYAEGNEPDEPKAVPAPSKEDLVKLSVIALDQSNWLKDNHDFSEQAAKACQEIKEAAEALGKKAVDIAPEKAHAIQMSMRAIQQMPVFLSKVILIGIAHSQISTKALLDYVDHFIAEADTGKATDRKDGDEKKAA